MSDILRSVELTSLGHEHISATRILATAELEQLLCDPNSSDALAKMILPAADSWTVRFPDLTSLPRVDGPPRKLKMCVATEDIVGPVRNGGIGTTYAALAEMLAAEGHETTILYLRGKEVETGTLEEWIEHYAAKGVNFVPVPNYAVQDGFRALGDRWLRAPYNMFRYLVDHPQDVVHVSEWRGSGYLSLLAKRQGIAFKDTLFVVKTSSPWMWNRMYGSQPLQRTEDITKVHGERKSVELADMVIGGSLHLLRWMLSQGYVVPRERTFVQPNVVSFEHLKVYIGQRALEPGSRMPVDEIVFFGRLEARKGLFTFVQAINRLIRQGVKLPPKISFMGKPGAKLSARPNQTVLEFIESETAKWPVEVTILTEFQQLQAIEYLLTGNRLAVMPSAIENSSLAVYEAALCGIPFVASDVGGTPELIIPEDRPKVLCAPHPIPLAAKIAEMVEQGAYVATGSFDNDENLAVWRRFHSDLGSGLLERLLSVHAASAPEDDVRVAACIYFTGDLDALETTFDSLAAQKTKPDRVLIAVDAPEANASAQVEELVRRYDLACRIVETFDFDAGLAFNALAETAKESHLLMMWEGCVLAPEAIGSLVRIMSLSGADVLNFFYREVDPTNPDAPSHLKANIIGSLTESFFRSDLTAQPLFVRREGFLKADGFTTDYRVLSYDQEFLSRAQLSGLHCETALVELATVRVLRKEWLNERCYDLPTSYFRAIRPQLATVPLAIRDLLLMAKGMSGGGGQGPKKAAGEAGKAAKAANGAGAVRSWGPQTKTNANGKAPGKTVPARASALIDNLWRLLDDSDAKRAPSSVSAAVSLGPQEGDGPANGAAPGVRKGIERRLLYVADGKIAGWAYDREAPDSPLLIEAVSGEAVVASAPAETRLELSPRLAQQDGSRRCFLINVFGERDVAIKKVVDLRVAGTDVYLARDLQVFNPAASMEASTYSGYCEPGPNRVVRGWVWDASDPGNSLEVDVFVGARFVGRTTADIYRADLEDAGIGSGQHGFEMMLPAGLVSDGGRVSVVVSRTGVPLRHSPLLIRNDRLVLPLSARLKLPASIGRLGRALRGNG